MPLTSGTKLGPYEIQSPLGAGGMGEVYRAKDTRLDRSVAIKVLPAHLASDPGLKQRLERESKAISALQHPNICTLFDVGSQDGIDYLVMELLDGQTLAERLEKGPLPLSQVLTVGIEIASALEKAHRQGIIHRDLKPANIMLTKSGAKLMDFGLAKPELAITGASGLTPSTPTMSFASLTSASSPLTQKGSIVGTFQYIAPEVLQGEEAGARADIFAFGCVLYEMVTGHRAFEGKSQISVLSAILEKEPEPLGSSQPPMLDRLIRACLVKDPADRLQSAHDAAMDLRWIAESSADKTKDVAPAEAASLKKPWLAAIVAATLAIAALAAYAGYSAKPNANIESLHVELAPPDKFALDTTGDAGGMPVLSPEGDRVAFVAHSAETKTLWVRPLNSDIAQQLEGTQGASHPFWSPEGRNLGFFANGKLMKVASTGGPTTVLADAPNGRGGSWGADGVIVFTPGFLGALYRVSAQGGPATPATRVVTQKHDTHRFPWFLPDGKHFLFFATSHGGGDPKQNGIYLAATDDKIDNKNDSAEARFVVATDSAAQYGSGYLLYRSESALVAQPFDPESGTLTGSPHPLVNNIRYDAGVWRSVFAVSQRGLLVFQTGSSAAAGTRMAWFDRAGKQLALVSDHEPTTVDLRLSPDGKRVAYGTASGIWTLDLERKTKTRITFDQETLTQPSWSADGSQLIFGANSKPGSSDVEIRSKSSDGTGAEKVLAALPHGDTSFLFPSLSPDGKFLTYGTPGGPNNSATFWMAPLPANEVHPAVAVVQPPSPQFSINLSRLSPDGRMVAYVSDESAGSGNTDVYVTTFPAAKGKWRVSNMGASYPAWSGNGKELFFADGNGFLYACAIHLSGSEIEVGQPQRLFHTSAPGVGFPYDVSYDGQKLLVNLAEEETQTPLRLVTNWPEELKK